MTTNALVGATVLEAVVGSCAYGLQVEDSDIDVRGIYLAPFESLLSLHGPRAQVTKGEDTYWELARFMHLALKGNPTVLECLYSPYIQVHSLVGELLLEHRDIFLSKQLYHTYKGYALSQVKRVAYQKGTKQGKYSMHAMRLLYALNVYLLSGKVEVRVPGIVRGELLEIRRGEMPTVTWTQVYATRLKIADAAYGRAALPEHPDHEAAERLLLRIRRESARGWV